MTPEEINTPDPEGYIRSDDFDMRKAWYKFSFGGNGDPYISIITEDATGMRSNSSVRVSTSGGRTPYEIKCGVASVTRAFHNYFTNKFKK